MNTNNQATTTKTGKHGTIELEHKLPYYPEWYRGTWKVRYDELRRYQARHGDCLVPILQHHKTALGVWVSLQRTVYREGRLHRDRRRALEDLGFVWDVRWHKWEVRCRELRAHYTKTGNGTTTVPVPAQLAHWVAVQRRLYRAGRLAPERVAGLSSISSFTWDTNEPAETRWTRRFEELCEYRARHHGSTRVPIPYAPNPQLGIWAQTQRLHYRHWSHDTDTDHTNNTTTPYTSLTASRVARLNSVHFLWVLPDARTVTWDTRYRELLDYQARHGHCRVPEKYDANPQLGTWVLNQRVQYRYLLQGEPSTLTEDRVARLEEAGFVWNENQHRWFRMLARLTTYHDEHGTFDVAADHDLALRHWVYLHRKEYKQPDGSTTLTPARIQALDEIGFTWSGVRSRKANKGVTADDWSLLFDRMKEQGISQQAPAKAHIFEGEDRFASNVGSPSSGSGTSYMDEDELLQLWNAEDEDEW